MLLEGDVLYKGKYLIAGIVEAKNKIGYDITVYVFYDLMMIKSNGYFTLVVS